MTLAARAEAFLAQERIAVVGVSRGSGTGRGIYDTLRKRGHQVFAVNPNTPDIDGAPCYPDLRSVPGGVNAVVFVTRPEITAAVVRECPEAGVTHVWMHHNALFGAARSSVSEDAVAFCREHGIEVIPGACPMMFGDQADVGHRGMRCLLGWTGGLPK